MPPDFTTPTAAAPPRDHRRSGRRVAGRPAAHAAVVAAEFGVGETPKLKVGFLHNVSMSAPSDELLLPLGAYVQRALPRCYRVVVES